MKTLSIQTSISIHAPVKKVWKALTDPKAIKQYMFGADVRTDWRPGSPIVYTGEYEGSPYEERGEILAFEPEKMLRTTNFSSMSGQEDKPENYHTVTYRVKREGDKTRVTISQDNIKNQKSADGNKSNWKIVLKALKRVVEEG
jgi:uncharacterized protein YndB with AHSA1/START domain